MDVFACEGCGSQWVRTEEWTPVDADGIVPDAIASGATSGRGAGAADTSGR